MALGALKGWTRPQKHVVAASYLAWTFDAFDFFALVFVLPDVAAQFGVGIPAVALAVTLTLAVRPLGAFLFGRLADDYGRRKVLIFNVICYSFFGFATAFSNSLEVFLVIRALFGVAMGGIWGIGASLAMETVQPKARGFVSGLLQSGYPSGYLVASIAFGALYVHFGWRGMFMAGLVPGLILAFYIYKMVPESASWRQPANVSAGRHITHLIGVAAALSVAMFLLVEFGHQQGLLYLVALVVVALALAAVMTPFIRKYWKLALYAILLMTGFNFFSHGTQDLYPVFLREQHHFDPATVTTITVILNLGAIVGGLFFASLSQTLGRRKTVIMVALLSLPVIYFWAYAPTAVTLALGAFLMQVCVQGAWGVVPVHLNEISPAAVRGTFGGTVYQIGNLVASVNAVFQAGFAQSQGGNYSLALAIVAGGAALLIAVMMYFGPEAHNVDMGTPVPAEE
ncbi:MAG: MFS transporter [Alphaproteobacteria bacterium]|nr:MFS transporter [Alphaproteobacteria bacterium]